MAPGRHVAFSSDRSARHQFPRRVFRRTSPGSAPDAHGQFAPVLPRKLARNSQRHTHETDSECKPRERFENAHALSQLREIKPPQRSRPDQDSKPERQYARRVGLFCSQFDRSARTRMSPPSSVAMRFRCSTRNSWFATRSPRKRWLIARRRSSRPNEMIYTPHPLSTIKQRSTATASRQQVSSAGDLECRFDQPSSARLH